MIRAALLRLRYTWWALLVAEMHLRAARCHWRKELKAAQRLQRWEHFYQGRQEAALNELLMGPPPGPTSVAVSWISLSAAVLAASGLFALWLKGVL